MVLLTLGLISHFFVWLDNWCRNLNCYLFFSNSNNCRIIERERIINWRIINQVTIGGKFSFHWNPKLDLDCFCFIFSYLNFKCCYSLSSLSLESLFSDVRMTKSRWSFFSVSTLSVCPFIEGNGYYSCESDSRTREKEKDKSWKGSACCVTQCQGGHELSASCKRASVNETWFSKKVMKVRKRDRHDDDEEEGWHTVCCADQEHELKETRNWRENEGQRRGRRIWNVTSNRGSIIRGTKKEMTLLSVYTFSSVVSS